ncbi:MULTISPECIES: hypothetical protein [Burkholderiaceae]|uniref:Uncharacterized protein n=1 Tax=Ralstonia mannitolilytica TaxID=105219 RepID=A0AAJ4ZNS7_9RALS|nr:MULTISPECIES: hypothetical protein [Burkholderiaceae]MCM3604064.1 hypothetical protein [Cupriavidus pauculus]CAG2149417.1 hypothetical protein LMG6866_03648 [Ralstonia mannitolilytica]CAJ0728626.1 hypothetical protein R76706_01765 [Ralstonia mannitolilytica]CAJ0739248.1 hypothetical protein R76696_02362 [Ralstonia mannitolilytica]CAJ0861356.1 hypothetical protein R77569_01427 [Ralstonia mannitolilytica]
MNSIRERILREVVARLSAAVAPVPVLRQPAVPVTRDASPALLLFAESDRITGYANHLVDRVLTLRLTVVARGDYAFDQADRTMVAAHSALMPDATLGGLALLLHEVDAEWDAEDADAGAVALPARYEIRYRTHAMDLTQKG